MAGVAVPREGQPTTAQPIRPNPTDIFGNPQQAPAGYTFDPIRGSYVPTVGAASTAAANAERAQRLQDQDRAQAAQRLTDMSSQRAADQTRMDQRQFALDAQSASRYSDAQNRQSQLDRLEAQRYEDARGERREAAALEAQRYGANVAERGRLENLLLGATSGGGGNTVGGVGGSAGMPPPISFTGLQAAAVPNVPLVDTSAAQSAEFARAKDKVGLETSGALTGLRSALAGRGMLGSQAEFRGTGNIVQAGQQQLGDTTREQAITAATQAQKNAETNAANAVTQRGQNITQQSGLNSLAVEQRGQDINAQVAANSLAAENARAAAAQRTQTLSGLLSALKY